MNQPKILERSQLEELDKSALIELIVMLQAQLAEQGKQIQKLSDQIAKHSQNSSKPPGSDGLKKKKTQSLRQKGEKPYGGQPGHKGDTLQMVCAPDVVIEHALSNCPQCQADLSQVAAVGYDKRQVFDIPRCSLK